MMLPWTNGTLTKITSVGTSGDFDVPSAPGTDRWTGSVGVTIRERSVETLSPGSVDLVKRTRMELPYEVGRLVVQGDTLTYSYEGVTHARPVDDVLRAELVGRVRVELEEA